MPDDIVTKHQAVYEQLKAIRASKTIALKPTARLRDTVTGLDGTPQPFQLRYYQVQAVYHLLLLKRMILGDSTGTGKTLICVAFFVYSWTKEPHVKAVVVTPKSALRQWAGEIARFTQQIRCYIVDGTPMEREATYRAFAAHSPDSEWKAVLLIGYAPLVRDWNAKADVEEGQPPLGLLEGIAASAGPLTVVFDECTAFKSDRTKTWQVCKQLSERADRCYGLTATLLKNNLIEGYSIYKVILPALFTNKTAFMRDYCITQLQRVAGGRKIPIVVGYKNLEAFRQRIDTFFLGRPKHAISAELPKLTTREVHVKLSAAEDAKYEEALTGLISLGNGDVKDYQDNQELVSLIYCQKTVDSLSLLGYREGNPIDLDAFNDLGSSVPVTAVGTKEQALLDLLTEEFDGEKVIVYCRFASLIPRLQKLCKDKGIESVAVTGDVVDTKKNPARMNAQKVFQDLNSKVKVIFISDAGSEAINLQAASAMVFYNAPWSWGGYVQLLGRPIRIGSPHERVIAVHLVAQRRSGKQTIDQYTLAILQKKKELIDKVLGEAAVGALNFEGGQSFARELASSLRRRPV